MFSAIASSASYPGPPAAPSTLCRLALDLDLQLLVLLVDLAQAALLLHLDAQLLARRLGGELALLDVEKMLSDEWLDVNHESKEDLL